MTLALLSTTVSMVVAVSSYPAEAAKQTSLTVVRVLGEGSLTPAGCSIVAEPLAGDAVRRLKLPIEPSAEVTLDLDLSQQWNVEARCRGRLAPPRIVGGPGATQPPVRSEVFPLRPGAWISGRFSPSAEPMPDRLYLEVEYPASDRTGPRAIGRARLPCLLEGASFSCQVPSGRFDGRLVAPGFAPHYLWAAQVQAGGTRDLGVLSLQRGASLAGWVTSSASVDFTSPPTVATLGRRRAEGWQGNPAEGRPSNAKDSEGRVTSLGFFQLTGLTAGAFELRIERQGWSSATLPVTLVDAEEFALAAPLALLPLAHVDILVSPPTAPDGTSWEARVLSLPEGSNTYESRAQGPVSEDGTWRSLPVVPGDYLLRLMDGTGAVWHEETLAIDPDGAPKAIDLELVPIEGVVRLGREPLAATLVFGTTQHVPNIRLGSDAKGTFAGYLPRDGLWPVEVLLGEGRQQRVSDVVVRKSPSGRPARVEIDLPATRLAGQVVADGRPVDDAFVLVVRAQGTQDSKQANLRVDRDGHFEVLGLAAGAVRVRAYDRTRSSSWVQAEIREDFDGPELSLELGEHVEIRGLLQGPSGPVPGGLIVAAAHLSDNQTVPLGETRSTPDGTFVFSIDSRATAIDAMAFVPGCGLELGRHRVSFDPGAGLRISCGPSRGRILLATVRPGAVIVHGGGVFSASGLLSLAERTGFLRLDEGGLGLSGMGRGFYRFCIAGRCVDGELAAGGDLTFDLVEATHADSN